MDIPAGKTYADIVRGALQNPGDRKSMREVGRNIGYSYEHIRKVLAGEVTFTTEFSDALSQELGLAATQMWALAQTLKLRKGRTARDPAPIQFRSHQTVEPTVERSESVVVAFGNRAAPLTLT
jgi:hypothetical protein